MDAEKKTKVKIINGPNLNLLGNREKKIYGNDSLDDVFSYLKSICPEKVKLSFFTSNHEGEIIDEIHKSMGNIDYIILNPGALTHYSYSLHDAVTASRIKTIEVHISNIYNRENWRAKSVISPAVMGTISGLGTYVYRAALQYIMDNINN